MVVILTQMVVGIFSVYTLSATRALVAGESLWSKGQHQAVYFLSLYSDTGEQRYRDSFAKAIAVPLAYRRGRDALEQTPARPDVTRRAFLEAGTAAEDIPSVIWLLRNFRGFSYLDDALARWRETDPLILELKSLGDADSTETDPRTLRARVEAIDRAITPRTVVFSNTLDAGARMVERLLLTANFALASLLAMLTIWRVGKVLKQRRQSEAALAWQASHDELTGLANRRAFEQHFAAIAADPRRGACTLLFVDLDQFKIVNDTCGHAAGDALLRRICAPIQSLLRSADLLARLGGDEFSILIPGTDLPGATALAERIREAVERLDFRWHGRTFAVTASIGLVHETGTIDPEQMMTKADMACFMAKEKGRNRLHTHRDEDQELLVRIREMNWVQRIQEALGEERFCLYAQEIVSLQDGADEALHVEILLRMRDEGGSLVPPASFIPAAERFGLMKQIDRWVVTETFKILAQRRGAARAAAIRCCAINLSGATIGDEGFLEFLKAAFARFDVAPELICFEVTETSAIVNLDAAQDFVRELRRFGCTFALDDFGSGMSSFNYLKRLPVDYLKIDGTFVKNLLTDRPDRAMVEMISHVGHIMGMRIVAEFVETQAIADALRVIGVDYGQGYGIARPRPFDAAFAASAARRPRLQRDDGRRRIA